MHFSNRNAATDGRWDAVHGLGWRNPYTEGSASWHAYNVAFIAHSGLDVSVAPLYSLTEKT